MLARSAFSGSPHFICICSATAHGLCPVSFSGLFPAASHPSSASFSICVPVSILSIGPLAQTRTVIEEVALPIIVQTGGQEELLIASLE